MTEKSLTLILMRHAEAEDQRRGQKDSSRRLTVRGHLQASGTADFLKETGAIPQQVIVSPAIRTQETLQEMMDVWGTNPQITRDENIYKVSHREPPYLVEFNLVDAFNDMLKQADPAHDCVMVLGHNPAIANLVQNTASTLPRDLNEAFPTATAVILSLHTTQWDSLAPRHATCKAVIYGGSKLIRMPDPTPEALRELKVT